MGGVQVQPDQLLTNRVANFPWVYAGRHSAAAETDTHLEELHAAS